MFSNWLCLPNDKYSHDYDNDNVDFGENDADGVDDADAGDAGDDDNDDQVRTLAGSVADLGGGREERVQRAITYPRN